MLGFALYGRFNHLREENLFTSSNITSQSENQSQSLALPVKRRRKGEEMNTVNRSTDDEKFNWLPRDWQIRNRRRVKGKTAGVVDTYYYDPKTHKQFRSKTEVLEYLSTGSRRKRKRSRHDVLDLNYPAEPVAEEEVELYHPAEPVAEEKVELYHPAEPVTEEEVELYHPAEPVAEEKVELYHPAEPVTEEEADLYYPAEPVMEEEADLYYPAEPVMGEEDGEAWIPFAEDEMASTSRIL